MKPIKLIPLMLLAACSSGPTNQEALKAFAAMSGAMGTSQSAAVSAAQTPSGVAPAALTLNYSGPCLAGGTAGVTGSYTGSDTGQQATFDMTVTFTACQTGLATLDGSLTWTASADATAWTGSIEGSLDYKDSQSAFTCDFDFQESVAVSSTSADVTYSGSICGLDVNSELHVGGK